MTSDNGTKLRLSVWRDYRPERPLAYVAHELGEPRFLQREDRLQQEVFAWQMREGVTSSVADDLLREKLETALNLTFSASLLPSARTCDRLLPFLEEARNAISTAATDWSDSEDREFENQDEPQRVNTLLAFYNHLLWLYEVFRDEPGISIIIR